MENHIKFLETTITDEAGDDLIIRTDGEDVFVDTPSDAYYFSPMRARELAVLINAAAESIDGVKPAAVQPLGSTSPPKWSFDGRVRTFGPAEIVPLADGYALFIDKRKVADFDADVSLAAVKAAAEAHVSAPAVAPRTWLVTVCGVPGIRLEYYRDGLSSRYVFLDGAKLPQDFCRRHGVGRHVAVWEILDADVTVIAQLTGPPESDHG